MIREEVYNNKRENDFLDLVELLKEIRKDEKNFQVDEVKENNVKDIIFNPLLEDYYVIKRTYLEKIKNKQEGFTREQLNQIITKLVKEQPNYKEAMDYIIWEEKREEEKENENNLNTLEDEEEESLWIQKLYQ